MTPSQKVQALEEQLEEIKRKKADETLEREAQRLREKIQDAGYTPVV